MEKKCDATVASFNWLNSPIVPLVVVPLVKNPATFSYAEEKHERKCNNNAEHDRLVLARIFILRSYAFYPREKKVSVRVAGHLFLLKWRCRISPLLILPRLYSRGRELPRFFC